MTGSRAHWLLFIVGLSMAGAASCTRQIAQMAEGASAPREATTTRQPPAIEIQQPQLDRGQIAEGRGIAVRECSACHAIDGGSTSPRREAPPLKTVLWRYDEEALATHLIEAIRVGHSGMPLFDFNVIGADALIAYLRSIRTPRDERGAGGSLQRNR
jgi:mono/diheme cytochrome c family protein